MRGFSLIEILVVIALLSVIAGLGLFMSMDSLRGYMSRSESDVVVSLLQRARSRAVSNIGQASWGVCFIAPNYIIHKGSVCTAGLSTNEVVRSGSGASVSGLAAPGVTFSALGGTTTAATITVVQSGRTAVITLNNEGRIDW